MSSNFDKSVYSNGNPARRVNRFITTIVAVIITLLMLLGLFLSSADAAYAESPPELAGSPREFYYVLEFSEMDRRWAVYLEGNYPDGGAIIELKDGKWTAVEWSDGYGSIAKWGEYILNGGEPSPGFLSTNVSWYTVFLRGVYEFHNGATEESDTFCVALPAVAR